MRVRHLWGVSLAAWVGAAGAAATPPAGLTLPDALRLARERNVDLALARIRLEDVRSRYREAIGAALPQAEWHSGYTRYLHRPVGFLSSGVVETARTHVADAGIDASQILYQGGAVTHGIKAARHALVSTQERVSDTDAEVALLVKNQFYTALLARETASIEADNLASAENHLTTIRERYRQGLDSDLIVQRQEVEVAAAKTLVIRARNLQELSVLSLQEILALPVDQPLGVDGIFEPPENRAWDYERLAAVACARHPGLAAAREERLAMEHVIGAARAEFWPQLVAFGRWGWRGESMDMAFTGSETAPNLGAGLQLRYALLTGGSRWQRVTQARLQHAAAREREQRFERQIRVEVRRQWLNIQEALARTKAQEDAIGQARKALAATEVRYKAGESSQLELNDAAVTLNQTRLRHAEAIHDFWTSLAALERLTGRNLQTGDPL